MPHHYLINHRLYVSEKEMPDMRSYIKEEDGFGPILRRDDFETANAEWKQSCKVYHVHPSQIDGFKRLATRESVLSGLPVDECLKAGILLPDGSVRLKIVSPDTTTYAFLKESGGGKAEVHGIRKADVKQAIIDMEDSRGTHIAWVKFFEEHPEQEKKYKKTIHGISEQREIIKQYDSVLMILRQLL